MKFNDRNAAGALLVFMCMLLLVGITVGLVFAWKYAPPLGAFLTLLIAVPLIAGFWPAEEE